MNKNKFNLICWLLVDLLFNLLLLLFIFDDIRNWDTITTFEKALDITIIGFEFLSYIIRNHKKRVERDKEKEKLSEEEEEYYEN